MYLEEKDGTIEQSVQVNVPMAKRTVLLLSGCVLSHSWSQCRFLFCGQIPGSMTAAELTCEVLDKRNIPFKDKEYWSCWEVCDKEEMGEILKDAKQPWIKKKKSHSFISALIPCTRTGGLSVLLLQVFGLFGAV